MKDSGNVVMRPSARDQIGVPAVPQPAFAGLRFVASLWNRMTLVTKFTVMTCAILLTLSHFSEWVQDRIAARTMIESSLEIEQSLARAVIFPILGDTPLDQMMPKTMAADLEKAVRAQLAGRYISKLKIWGITGRQIFDSASPLPVLSLEVPAVTRAIAGETVVSVSDMSSTENLNDQEAGETVYEVYMPLYNSTGQLIAIGEIYCNIKLGGARIQAMLAEIDQVRLVVLGIGMLMLVVLVYFAQRRIDNQEDQLVRTLRATENLARTNEELLQDSERLRRSSAEASEQLLNQIGAELHDGPIQLLSIAALYRSQSESEATQNMLTSKARDLSDQALRELRNISVGLILPELEGASLQDVIRGSCAAFSQDTGLLVDLRLTETADHLTLPELVVAYRVVQEALHNARKHAGGVGLRVTLRKLPNQYEIEIEDSGEGEKPDLKGHLNAEEDSISLGLLGMQKRARSVGGTLSVRSRDFGTVVRLTLGAPRIPKS